MISSVDKQKSRVAGTRLFDLRYEFLPIYRPKHGHVESITVVPHSVCSDQRYNRPDSRQLIASTSLHHRKSQDAAAIRLSAASPFSS